MSKQSCKPSDVSSLPLPLAKVVGVPAPPHLQCHGCGNAYPQTAKHWYLGDDGLVGDDKLCRACSESHVLNSKEIHAVRAVRRRREGIMRAARANAGTPQLKDLLNEMISHLPGGISDLAKLWWADFDQMKAGSRMRAEFFKGMMALIAKCDSQIAEEVQTRSSEELIADVSERVRVESIARLQSCPSDMTVEEVLASIKAEQTAASFVPPSVEDMEDDALDKMAEDGKVVLDAEYS